ncbi:hypothetical protein ANCCEY_07610 [Ancylostoma ceylanicum]|uniref:WAP domain-containing protein n=1 Tax=Ancylostoma ceylanicum TaxID=53326 RepID=A0A0D6M0A8_9BILA|nr:hypothetical protein ANCCEY_07610 [Ancylostoma ceylanicum]
MRHFSVFSADTKCTTDKDCPTGMKCSNKICGYRTECAQLGSPKVPAGCKAEPYVNDKGCTMSRVVCP